MNRVRDRHGNCEPIRRYGPRHALRLAVMLVGIASGMLLAWQVAPFGDLWATEVVLAQGAFAGALLGVVTAAQIRVGQRRTVVRSERQRDIGAH